MDKKDIIISEIELIVARLKEVQETRKLSDRQMAEEFSDLGSAKTWKSRLLARDYTGLNLDRLISNLRRIAVILDGGTPDEIYYPDAPFSKEMTARIRMLESSSNDRRILAALASNGTGKSSFSRWCVSQAPNDRKLRVAVRVRPTWRNKPLNMSLGAARAIGLDIDTTNPAVAEAALIDALQQNPRTVFFDQAHEGGVGLMHLLRVLVDETPSRFVYMAYDTAFKQVLTGSSDALMEAKAFLGRCLKPTFNAYAHGVLPADVAFYLQKLIGMKKDAATSLAVSITPTLQAQTNLRLLQDAIESVRAAHEVDDISPELLFSEIRRLAGLPAQEPKGKGSE